MQTAIPISAIILDTLLKATVLLALASGAALALKKRSAATRHMVRAFALAALLLLPFSVVMLPELPVKGLPGFVASKVLRTRTASTAPERTAAASLPATPALAPSASSVVKPRVQRPRTQSRETMSAPTATADRYTSASPVQASSSPITNSANPKPSVAVAPTQPQWKTYLPQSLLLIWIIGAIYLLVRWKWNALHLSGLVRRATVLTDSGWNAQLRSLSGDLGIERHVALLVSDELEVPITAGIMFPKVVLSPDYAEWSPQRRSAILNHELAHIRRLDAFTLTLAQITTALYWFHPLVWFMVRAMRAERERACDDQVLASGTKASEYAHELLDIVSELRGPELAAALAMARRSQL
ncbi:MAG TPA: M56 family metallopeptidase, partial [Candidatus Angelobacter sp.]|nr:M56 family metallopeptidase [Candidatus Angelobacter sp.]